MRIGGFEDEGFGSAADDADDSFDLAAELAGALGVTEEEASAGDDVDDGFSAVFSAFKKDLQTCRPRPLKDA